MLTIGYIVGSLAPDSINRQLARVLAHEAPQEVETREIDIAQLPLYDRHMDADFPEVMSEFKDQVADVDGLLLVTPEHNQAYPAAVKNALDILTRGGSSQLKGLPMGIVGASPSRFGTINSQGQLHQFLPRLGVKLMGTPVLALQVSDGTFDEDGAADPETSQRAVKYMRALADFVQAQQR